MNVPQTDLDAAALALVQANGRLTQAVAAANRAGCDHAATLAEEGRAGVWQTYLALKRAGAADPFEQAGRNEAPELPLRLLDTDANRRLLAALEAAHDAALEVDQERAPFWGGFADVLAGLVADKRDEIGGPVGAGRE